MNVLLKSRFVSLDRSPLCHRVSMADFQSTKQVYRRLFLDRYLPVSVFRVKICNPQQ